MYRLALRWVMEKQLWIQARGISKKVLRMIDRKDSDETKGDPVCVSCF